MKVFILSLIAPFLAIIMAYLILRAKYETWPPPDAPPLPGTLWLSTGIVLAISGAVQWALASVREDRIRQLHWAMGTSLLLGLGFLGTQSISWIGLMEVHRDPAPEMKAFANTFYVLTGVHAVHVLGGLMLTLLVSIRALRGSYWSYHHPGVIYHAMYWHFLDAVWVVLFVVLFVGSHGQIGGG